MHQVSFRSYVLLFWFAKCSFCSYNRIKEDKITIELWRCIDIMSDVIIILKNELRMYGQDPTAVEARAREFHDVTDEFEFYFRWQLVANPDGSGTMLVVADDLNSSSESSLVEEMMHLMRFDVLGELTVIVNGHDVSLYAIVDGVYGPHVIVRKGKVVWDDEKTIYRKKDDGEIVRTTS